MRSRLASIFAGLALFVACAATSFGQATGGAVTGDVLDATGAVVPNATVTLRSKQTGQTLTSQTTGSGSYSFPNVPVGDYTITVESGGFAPATQDLRVTLNQTTTVNATLQAAGITGVTVDVTAASEALVQSDSSQLGKSFEERQIIDLPTFGNQNNLALLAPNVVNFNAFSGTSGTGGAVGGVRARYNSFNIDGVDNNQFSVTGPQTTVIPDAIQEFTLLSNNFNAEFGQASGGQFNTVTKAGTNEWNGSAFVYAQNQKLNAASTAQEAQIKQRLALEGTADEDRIRQLPRFVNTRYGLTVGGPFVKNKLFFFGAYQHETNGRSATGSSFLSPTLEGLNQLAAIPGVSPLVLDIIRANLVLAPAQTTTQTVAGRAIPFGSVNLTSPSFFNDFQGQINIDHLRGTKDQFRYRFSADRFRTENANGLGNAQFNALNVFDSRLFSATWVRTLSPSLVNDLRLSYRRVISDTPLKNAEFNTFPNLTVSASNTQIGPNSNLPQSSFNNNYQAYDSISYVRGQHNFKFGGEYRNLIATSQFLPRGRGDYLYATFDLLLTDQTPTTAIRGVGSGGFTFNQEKYYVFGQDDWKVTPNLTLNLGLRYEYNTLPRDVALQALNSISDVPGVLTFGVPKTDRNNFAPRVGFAYSPDYDGGVMGLLFGSRGQSSIRAHFGVSYAEIFGNLALLLLPPQFQQELRATDLAGFNTSPGFLARGGLPSIPNPPTTPALARAATTSFTDDQIQPYTLSWTLSYQRELSPTTAIEFRYLGTRSRKLPVQIQINAGADVPLIIPTFIGREPTGAELAGRTELGTLLDQRRRRLSGFGFTGNITSYKPIGNSQYDAGSVSLTRRFSQGLAATAAYTFSKTIDDSTNEVFSSAINPRRPQDPFNMRDERSLSVFDIPHRFVMSFNYDLPFFRESDNDFAKVVFGGWQINSIFQAQSGQPFTPQSIVDSNLNLDSNAGDRTIFNPGGVEGTGSNVRAVNAAGATVPLGDRSTVAYVAVNPNAQYILAGPGARPNAGRNTLRSNGFNRTDAVLLKNFPFAENRYNVQIGAEFINLFNQRIRTIGNFATIPGTNNVTTAPGLSATDFAFANVGSPFFNSYSLGNFAGRTVQLRAKLTF
ncbi:MAG TPA: TonB-dependent receptor [Pyrinomonadaceae bacterium]|nr:TonB-dependent receptor [Pyrinomonadaceae bacterium]